MDSTTKIVKIKIKIHRLLHNANIYIYIYIYTHTHTQHLPIYDTAVREIVSENMHWIQLAQRNIQWRIFSQTISVQKQLRTSLSLRINVTFVQRTWLLFTLVTFKLINNSLHQGAIIL